MDKGAWPATVLGVAKSQTHPLSYSWVQTLPLGVGAGDQSYGYLYSWRDAVGVATQGQETGVYTTSPAATGFSGAVDSAVTTRSLGWQVPPLPFPQFHLLCVFQSTPVRCTDMLKSQVSWAEIPLLSCECFTDCTLKGRDKECISLHHDADATSILVLFYTKV